LSPTEYGADLELVTPLSAPHDGRPARPTIRDVAAAAGVSFKTVSRVVNGEAGVRPETAARVRTAIDELGFSPNELASGLRHRRAGALGLVIEDVGNPFYSSITRAVEAIATARGHLLLTGSCGEDADRERHLVARFLGRAVDALLIVPAGGDHRYLAGMSGGTPVVFLDRPATGIDADTVIADNRGGARAGVEHLLAHGHRRIGVVADAEDVWTASERLAGHAEALEAAGVASDPALIRSGVRDAAQSELAVRELLALPADRRPTALFTANNRITLGALRAVRDTAAPVALVGFDDFEFADMLTPAITVVRQDPTEMGRRAAEAAYRRLDGQDGPAVRQLLPTELVPRGSGEVSP
jgi:LacI family transcriptional regulator